MNGKPPHEMLRPMAHGVRSAGKPEEDLLRAIGHKLVVWQGAYVVSILKLHDLGLPGQKTSRGCGYAIHSFIYWPREVLRGKCSQPIQAVFIEGGKRLR